ncbi:DUF4136 domain-containing protein [Sphingomonas sp. AR_OL41]|jgi:hypothetical protein|uniref:DUF4136 domain-containing protein n=1 Tax=Sphingomonas sp. AR_OL41 TaxID=3042729 RepID=UPI00248014D0|nr:DUF4136 domain-containing protein [Sphingomonas sp. AR_OL41]MDH7974626.1 DUF4136 domain-containing protein [Sphingomonas sp. AR_OL41]
MKFVRLTATLLALSGCTTVYKGSVARTHTMPPPGLSFVVHGFGAEAEANQYFAASARQVSANLQAAGYRLAPDDEHADLIVRFGYRIGAGYRVSGPGQSWVSTGGPSQTVISRSEVTGPSGSSTISTQSTYDGGTGSAEPYTFAVHDNLLMMRIARRDTKAEVFQGTVRAQTDQDGPSLVIPTMIKAMFRDFPGKSGTTENLVGSHP